MFNRKSVVFALLFSAILVALFVTTVGAASSPAPVVKLSIDQKSFATTEGVVVRVTITNPTSRPVKVLKWFTPAAGVEGSLFTVTRNGQPVSYVGPLYKRPAPTGADYVTIQAGKSITRKVVLSDYYDFSATGDYAVAYNVSAWNLFSEKGSLLKRAESLISNKMELKVEGRAVKTPESFAPTAVTGSTSFTKCTTTQQSTIISARAQASTYSNDALAYLNANKQGSRYTTWFGTYLSTRYTTAKTHFASITSAMDTAPVTVDCGCKKKYYAYVYPTQPYKIYVCSVFWTAPLSGTDSKAGTLIHEMSHFNVVAATSDYVYGQTGAKSLAISDPNKAVNNADNHEYFAENTPALP